MTRFEFIDFIQRKINSILFRIVLVAFAIILLLIFNNEFTTFSYVSIFTLYFAIYLSLLKYSKLRLFNDFIFINLILWGKNPNEVIIFTFIILPIINSINFSGQKKSVLLYLYTAITFLLLLCHYNHKLETKYIISNLYPISSIIFLWLINSYTSLRIKIRNFREELNSVVDNYYLKKEEIKRPHVIYNLLIDIIHKNIKKNLIEEIICFTSLKNNGDKLFITNGSRFIWEFEFTNKFLIKDLREKNNLLNQELNLDGIVKPYNLILYSKVKEHEYVYALITKRNIPFYYWVIGFFRTLQPTFNKISTILLSEKKLQDIKNEEIAKLSERSQYVNRANNTMHFIRNRLGPFSNLLKMLEQFKSIPEEKMDIFKSLVTQETERSRIELNNIIDRADAMLEKSKNPFLYTNVYFITLEKIFTILKRNVYNYFPYLDIKINKIPDSKKFILLNEEGFELFLSDWLNNMSKYKKSEVACNFFIENTFLNISFINDHNLSNDVIDKMIDDLTSQDRNEIMKRTTHGLYIIKSALEDMNIPFEVKKVDKKIMMTLKLTIFDDENSNI